MEPYLDYSGVGQEPLIKVVVCFYRRMWCSPQTKKKLHIIFYHLLGKREREKSGCVHKKFFGLFLFQRGQKPRRCLLRESMRTQHRTI